MRRILLAAATSPRLRSFAEGNALSHRVVDRFVAGDTLDDAVAVIRECNARGASVTIDHLGEAVTSEATARDEAAACEEAIVRIGAEGLDASLSVKPTALGLDVSEALFAELVEGLCERAGLLGIHVTLDMEGSPTTQATVDLVAELAARGHAIGCAVQAYLRRSPEDVARLTAIGASLRICKGAYAEPEELALQDRQGIREAFLALAEHVLDAGVFGRFATHDDWLIERIAASAASRGVGADTWEFQMLYGVREPLQREVLAQGHALRIYVPYGTQWYPYFMRRLAERPANLGFFARALVGRR